MNIETLDIATNESRIFIIWAISRLLQRTDPLIDAMSIHNVQNNTFLNTYHKDFRRYRNCFLL